MQAAHELEAEIGKEAIDINNDQGRIYAVKFIRKMLGLGLLDAVMYMRALIPGDYR